MKRNKCPICKKKMTLSQDIILIDGIIYHVACLKIVVTL